VKSLEINRFRFSLLALSHRMVSGFLSTLAGLGRAAVLQVRRVHLGLMGVRLFGFDVTPLYCDMPAGVLNGVAQVLSIVMMVGMVLKELVHGGRSAA
jgi:hypothetical protein